MNYELIIGPIDSTEQIVTPEAYRSWVQSTTERPVRIRKCAPMGVPIYDLIEMRRKRTAELAAALQKFIDYHNADHENLPAKAIQTLYDEAILAARAAMKEPTDE